MGNQDVGAEGVAVPGYGAWAGKGLGPQIDYPCGGLGSMGREMTPIDGQTGVVTFITGATRSTDTPFDPEGFISPAVLAAYSDYMAKHRVQKDGKVRDSDNWQKGMPTSRAYRSLTRHFMDLWLLHRGYPPRSADCGSFDDALCAILFNTMLIMKNRIDKDDHE
jgi:hypothetical protein